MALSRSEINQRSNERRGVVNKAFKLKQETVDLIIQLAEQRGLSQVQLVTLAVQQLAKQSDPTADQ